MTQDISTAVRRIHPLVAAAAISVTVLSLAGIAAVTGLISSPFAKTQPAGSEVAAAGGTPPAAAAVPAGKPSPATAAPAGKPGKAAVQAAVNLDYGVVASIRKVEVQGKGTGVGVIGGGVVGGALGHQMGNGNGQTAMTVLGAVGGAVAGNEIEKRARSSHHYVIAVRLEDGSTRTLTYNQAPTFQVGDRIKLPAVRQS